MFDKPLSDKVIEDVVSVNKRNLRFKDFPLKGKTRSTRRPLIDWLESQYRALKPLPSNSYGFDFKGYDQNDVLTYIKYNSIYSEGFTDDALEEAMGGIRLHTKLAKAKKLLNEISYHLILIFPRNSSFIDSEVLRKEIITYLTVFWNEDSTSEYDDIVALDIDKEMGYPRMVIRDSNNIVEVINLDFVQAYQAKLETVQ